MTNDINIEKQYNGSYLASTIIGTQLVKKVYYGYTKKGVKKKFKTEFIKKSK